jgi:hypothetical protein
MLKLQHQIYMNCHPFALVFYYLHLRLELAQVEIINRLHYKGSLLALTSNIRLGVNLSFYQIKINITVNIFYCTGHGSGLGVFYLLISFPS